MKPNFKRRKILGSLFVGGVVQGCGGSSPAAAPAPVSAPSPSPVLILPDSGGSGPLLSSLSDQTIYIAHRGGAALYPEETYLAFDESVRNAQTLLECDVQMLADGTLGLMHDNAVDRTTNGSGDVASFTESTWRALRVDSDTWHGSSYGNDLAVPLFSEWVQKYRGKAILVPEDKDFRSTPAMVAILDASKVDRDQVLLQSFSMAPLVIAAKAGYQTCFLSTGSATPAAAVAAGIGWAGMPDSTPSADVKKWVDSGRKVLLWTVNRRFVRDAKVALGVKGFFSDDPIYLTAKTPFSASDQFSTRRWAPGMLGNGSDSALALRGEFFSGGYWGYSSVKAGYIGCLHGYLCPIRGISEPSRYDIELKITYDLALAADGTGWASIFLGVDDRPFLDAAEFAEGYHILLRKNGGQEIYKKTPGVNPTLLVSGMGAAISDGKEVRYRVSVSESSIKLIRLNVDGNDSQTTVAQAAGFAGAYIHLGRSGLACRFSQISVK